MFFFIDISWTYNSNYYTRSFDLWKCCILFGKLHESDQNTYTHIYSSFLSSYTKVQLLQLKLRVDKLQNDVNCNKGLAGFSINWLSIDLPQVLTLSVIAIISAIVASKLYYQFGWNVYKRIGGDYRIQSKRFLKSVV